MAENNEYVDITFSSGVYTNMNGTGGLKISDFDLIFSKNGGNAENIGILSVTDVNGNVLSGGETTVRVNLDLEGAINGLEYIEIKPKDNEIFSVSGLKVSVSESTGNIYFESMEDWLYAKKIYFDTTVNGAGVANSVSNFPLLINLDSTNFNFDKAKSDGSDIRFVSDSGEKLFYEIEKWDKLNKTASVWVFIPEVLGNSNTQFITMYWGKDNVLTQSNGENVFYNNNNYIGVWHLRENGNNDAGGYIDSTNSGFNVTGIGMVDTSDVNSIISKGQRFSGTNNYINGVNDNALKLTGDMTISFG